MRVTLRQKKRVNGDLSLYLDFYPPILHPDTSKPTRREFLKLYLVGKPQGQADREQNKETKILAEHIRAQRQIAIQNGHYDFISKKNSDVNFVDFFLQLTEKRKDKQANYSNWLSTLNYLRLFTSGKPLLTKSLTIQVAEEFKTFLDTTKSVRSQKKKLSQNSKHSYFNKFIASLRLAFKEGLLKENIADVVEHIKPGETKRDYLTLEELQRLVNAECDSELLKRAALFSALTGLRWVDVTALTWADVQHSKAQGGYFIAYRQKKTQSIEWQPISDQAYNLLGELGNQEDRIFKGLIYSTQISLFLSRWMLTAGVLKKITFHNFRHTFATLQLTAGSDLYTISKMLGHKNVRTTQIYTKVIDEKKREAANKIKLDF